MAIEQHAREAVDLLMGALRDARIDSGDVAAIYLCGGSSEIPLIQRLLADHFEKIKLSEPKLIVSKGAAEALAGGAAVVVKERPTATRSTTPKPAERARLQEETV